MTLKISREWATPAALGVFALMSLTGLLMFFHVDSGLQKTIHEWAGWAVVAFVALHAVANWAGFKRYFTLKGRAPVILAACALVMAGSFFSLQAGGEAGGGASPPAIAMRAMGQAPVGQVAALFGKSGAQAVAELAEAGIVLADEQASIGSAIGGDREKMARALQVLARRAPR